MNCLSPAFSLFPALFALPLQGAAWLSSPQSWEVNPAHGAGRRGAAEPFNLWGHLTVVVKRLPAPLSKSLHLPGCSDWANPLSVLVPLGNHITLHSHGSQEKQRKERKAMGLEKEAPENWWMFGGCLSECSLVLSPHIRHQCGGSTLRSKVQRRAVRWTLWIQRHSHLGWDGGVTPPFHSGAQSFFQLLKKSCLERSYRQSCGVKIILWFQM